MKNNHGSQKKAVMKIKDNKIEASLPHELDLVSLSTSAVPTVVLGIISHLSNYLINTMNIYSYVTTLIAMHNII